MGARRRESYEWQRIAHAASALSDADGIALEERVAADPNDVEARVTLAGFYFLRLAPQQHRRRAEHVAWLALHHPEINLGGWGYIEEEHAPEGYEAARQAWLAAASAPDVSTKILHNAARFLGFNRPEEAERLYRRIAASDPKNAQWPHGVARMLSKRARWADEVDEQRRLARAALDEIDTALSLTHDDDDALGLRIEVVEAAVLAEDWERVRATAERALGDAASCTHAFHGANAIHWANIGLGWAALASDEARAAATYLLRAGKTEGSATLNSYGPDLDLADALLEHGEREAVRTYLTDCGRFWKGHESDLRQWIAAVDGGASTLFEEDDEHPEH